MKKLFLAVGAVLASASNSFAAMDVSGVSFSLTNHEALGVLMLGATAGIWLIKSVVRMPGRG